MSKTVVGIFDNHSSAENAARQIKDQGFRTDDISILAKESDTDAYAHSASPGGNTGPTNNQPVHDNISDGVVTGTVLGGLAGLLIGVGTLIVPGLGVIAAAGPIVGTLSGAVTGGVVGGLVDLGIPEDDSKEYESQVRNGKVLLTMKCDDEKVDSIESILRNSGASKVETH